MNASGEGRVWRIRIRGAMSSTVADALPDVAVIETGTTTLVEGDGALGETIDHLQAFGLEVVEVHESRTGRDDPAQGRP